MDVNVTINGNNITNKVIKYDREHKICSGIGLLEMEISYEYSGSLNPWDEIVIFENGKRSGQYFISTTKEGQPNASIIIEAQDNSKRLSDYFISDSYTIDYPSLASFWIGYFLDEVGITYRIISSDPGTILSNNTALGLMSAYEQIMYLLQLNGWYITFDYNGTAIIGKLLGDYAVTDGSIGDRDILDIKSTKSDSMLRNRVVVWGNGNPDTGRWVFADVSKPTKWDYDSNDKRTIVISNSNVKKISDAFWLANKALLEFSNITVEKEIEIEGARNYRVGGVISVRNTVFSGKGKITTFGTSLSSSGLITRVKLDERCPRLFAFWDMGGFVYVSTYGSGVWRKHIQPAWSGSSTGSGLIGFASGFYNSSGWFDYSSGLYDGNMFVTDLHINNGLLVCVTNSGQSFYSIEDEHPWSGIQMSGFTVTISGDYTLMSNGIFDFNTYSGIMTRACIIDRDTNAIKLVVDTRSGENLGDFLMETDPFANEVNFYAYYVANSGVFASGITMPSGMRSWVLDVNGYDGSIRESFPVNISGYYDFWTYDIENDGTHDYIEAMTFASGSFPTSLTNNVIDAIPSWEGDAWIPGLVANGFVVADRRERSMFPFSGYPDPVLQDINRLTVNHGLGSSSAPFAINDNAPGGDATIAFMTPWSTGQLRFMIYKYNVGPSGTISGTPYSKTISAAGEDRFVAVKVIDNFTFRFVLYSRFVGVYYYDFNYSSNTLGSRVVVPGSITVRDINCYRIAFNKYSFTRLAAGDKFYTLYAINETPGFRLFLHTTDFKNNTSNIRLVASAFRSGRFCRHPYPVIVPYKDDDVRIICPYIDIESRLIEPGLYACDDRIFRITATGKSSANDSVAFDWFGYSGITVERSFDALDDGWEEKWVDSNEYPNRFSLQRINDERFVFTYGYDLPADYPVSVMDTFDSVTTNTGIDSTPASRLTISLYRHPQRRIGIGYNSSESKFEIFDVFNLESMGFIDNANYTFISIAGFDFYNGDVYFKATNISTSDQEMVAVNPYTSQVTRRWEPTNSLSERIYGKFSISGSTTIQTSFMNPVISGVFPVYFVLQRDNYDFNVVKSGFFRDRLDISNYAPMLTMDRRVSSLESYYISTDDNVTAVLNPSISGFNMGSVSASGSLYTLGVTSDDFRYAGIDHSTSESGYMTTAFVVFSGQLGTIPIDTMESLSGIFNTQSGFVSRIETSNYFLPDQYLFVTLSGYGASGLLLLDSGHLVESWGFMQKNPSINSESVNLSGWVDYSSGFPQARPTMIRLDDAL